MTQRRATRAPVTAQPGQTYFEIHYSGLSFINPELVKFKYRLVGLDRVGLTRARAASPIIPTCRRASTASPF
jgi:hypothetical protein